MKTTYRIYFTALILIMALSACTKEATPGKVDTDSDAGILRTIAVSFDTQSQTRTVLNGLKPTFEDGDVVLVAQNSGLVDPEECTVHKVGDKYIIQTKIQGQIQMVYPATSAKVEKNAITGVTVPSKQTGKFADANICMTETIDQNTTTAVFKNKVAILKFYADESIGVKSITIQSEKPRISDGETGYRITVEPSAVSNNEAAAAQEVSAMDSRIWYAAIYTGDQAQANNLTFTSETTTQDAPVIKTPTSNVALLKGTMYNVFIPYYIKVKVSEEPEKYQRWAYCNVGAFLPEEPGLYFAWGDTKGYKWDAEKEQFEDGHSFSWANCPFNGGSEDFSSPAFKAAKATAFPSGTLVLGCDAANVNWGDKWRIPTSEEFDYVKDNAVHVDGGGISLGNHLFFPAAGSGDGAELTRFGQGSDYWSNTAYLSGEGDLAHALEFFSFYDEEEGELAQKIYLGCPSRNTGFPIRPIYDPDLSEENDPVSLTITAYPNGGTF